MALTGGHAGDIEYCKEATFGAGLPATGTLQIPSDSILNVELSPNPIVERHFTISDDNAIDTSHHGREWVLTIEYKLQQWKSTGDHHNATNNLEYYAEHRTAKVLDSLSFIYTIKATECVMQLNGCKVNNIAYGCAVNETIIMSVEIWGTTGSTNTDASDFNNYSNLTSSAAIGEAFEVYGGAAVTRSGAFAAGVKNATFSLNNNLERIPKIGSQDTNKIMEGHIVPSISGEVLADTGAKADIDDLLGADETDIVFDTGTTASKSQKLTFTNPTYDSMPIVYRVDDTHIVLGCDLTAEAIALAAYS